MKIDQNQIRGLIHDFCNCYCPDYEGLPKLCSMSCPLRTAFWLLDVEENDD